MHDSILKTKHESQILSNHSRIEIRFEFEKLTMQEEADGAAGGRSRRRL